MLIKIRRGRSAHKRRAQERMALALAAPAVDGTPAQILYKITPIFLTEQCMLRSAEVLHVMTWRSAN
eukprot:1714791-Pleurochrysis_carterae.AAC.1